MVFDVNLSPPWVTYANEVKAMFRDDFDVIVDGLDSDYNIRLRVKKADKAAALTKLLKPTVKFGYITITVNVIVVPANENEDTTVDVNSMKVVDLYKTALEGNMAFEEIVEKGEGLPFAMNYVVFKNQVVQFYNEDLSDPLGMCSTLYQTIADHIFNRDLYPIFFSTKFLLD